MVNGKNMDLAAIVIVTVLSGAIVLALIGLVIGVVPSGGLSSPWLAGS